MLNSAEIIELCLSVDYALCCKKEKKKTIYTFLDNFFLKNQI